MLTDCNVTQLIFEGFEGRRVVGAFDGGAVTWQRRAVGIILQQLNAFPNFANSVFERGAPGCSIGVFTLLTRRNILRDLSFDREVDILRNVARHLGNAEGIELLHHDAKKSTALIEEWATAVAWLHRGGD